MVATEVKDAVLVWLRGAIQRLAGSEAPWSLSQVVVDDFAKNKCKYIYRLCQGQSYSGSDVLFSALAQLIKEGCLVNSFTRKHVGGAPVVAWGEAAMAKCKWNSSATSSRMLWSATVENVWEGIRRSPGVVTHKAIVGCQMALSLQVIPGAIRSTWRRLKSSFQFKHGVDLFHTVVAFLAVKGRIYGYIGRTKSGGGLDLDWFETALPALHQQKLIPAQVRKAVYSLLVQGVSALECRRKRADSIEAAEVWVLDICCGYRSRESPVLEFFESSVGASAAYVGLDLCPLCYDGQNYHCPDWCVDISDEALFPGGNIVATVASRFGLKLEGCVHVFASTPCECNSPADRSNRNEGFGYRDWKSPVCAPLPVSSIVPCPPGFTSQRHHDLAKQHDELEQFVVSGVVQDAKRAGYSFSFENPVGALERKAVMQQFKSSPLRVIKVNHCAYACTGGLAQDGWYKKSTHYFTNLPCDVWRPTGLTGTGRCGGRGSNKVRRCLRGKIVKRRWKHLYTIGRESQKEFTSESVSRAKAKNEIPALQTSEIMQAAWEDWCVRV